MRLVGLLLALSFGVQAFADVNTINDGASIKGGTYLNSPGAETKFINSKGTGITLDAGQNIRGAEFLNGSVTGNGGNIHIDAPDQVVRLNGNIDVRGFVHNPGDPPSYEFPPTGSGGNVTIDAAYLFQNGNIYATGHNGGNVQFNVGGMTMGQTSRIDASGMYELVRAYDGGGGWSSGHAGSVKINSPLGDVAIQNGAKIIANGVPVYDQGKLLDNIEIVGRAVNMDGVLLAGRLESIGGNISLKSTGQADVDVMNIGQNAIIQTDGGNVSIESQRDLNQQGLILTNGASTFLRLDDTSFASYVGQDGGNVSLKAGGVINNTGRIQADGGKSAKFMHLDPLKTEGGKAGDINLTAQKIINSGVIRGIGGASDIGKGGNGSNVTLSANPEGNGVIVTFGGTGTPNGSLGTITSLNPSQSTNTLIGVWKKQ